MGYAIKSFEGAGPTGLDSSMQHWLSGLANNVEVISITKYCRGDGRWHYCTVLYREKNDSSSSNK